MKKLLVILMLGAGFVTVASADEPLDCNNNNSNPCCNDVVYVQNLLAQQKGSGVPLLDGYNVLNIQYKLVNSDLFTCIDTAEAVRDGKVVYGDVKWSTGDWPETAEFTATNPSANKDKAIITNN